MSSGSVPSSIARGRVSAVVLAIFFSGAATCGSGASPTAPVDELGQFTATVSGAVSAQLSGSADALGTASGTPGWALGMTALDGSGGISFVEEGMPRPSPGTYALASALEHGGNAPNSQFTATVGFRPVRLRVHLRNPHHHGFVPHKRCGHVQLHGGGPGG